MRPYQLATQTTNTHNKHMRSSSCNKMIKTQNDIQHYKHTHTHKPCPNQRSPTKGQSQPGHQILVCDARVHYPIIKNQETNQHPPPITGSRHLMPQTPNSASCKSTRHICSPETHQEQAAVDCVPLVNTPNRNPTNEGHHGVCSLERR